LGEDGTEAVAYVDDFGGRLHVVEPRESAGAEHFCDLVYGGEFGWGLDYLNGISVGGLADPKSIDSKGGISIVVDCNVNVGIVVVVERDVPVAISY
jgi:hypothetical protein